MHYLNNGSQVTAPPEPKARVGQRGYFGESNEKGAPSYPGPDWYNAVIKEAEALYTAADVEFNPDSFDHLKKSVLKLIEVNTPNIENQVLSLMTGFALPFLDSGDRPGWIDAKGGELSRTTDKVLWDYAVAAGMVVTQASKDAEPRVHAMKFGDGDGSTTFTLPNFHLSHFVRGAPTGVEHGQTQDDAIRNIMARLGTEGNGNVNYLHAFSGATEQQLNDVATGAFRATHAADMDVDGGNNYGRGASINLDFDASKVVPTATENRPYAANLTYKICRGWK